VINLAVDFHLLVAKSMVQVAVASTA